MIQPLFVNFKEEFIQRMKMEAGTSVLLTSSASEGLNWILNPEIPISAIYLNASDSSFSALQFLETTALERPATPVFILDEESDLTSQNLARLVDKLKIKGVFKGTVSLQDFLKALPLVDSSSITSTTQRASMKSNHAGYTAIPIMDFIYSKFYPFNVFAEDESQHINFFAMEGSEIDLEYLAHLNNRGPCLFVEESSIHNRKESYTFLQSSYLDPAYLSPSWRRAETLYRVKELLKKIKAGGVSAELVNETEAVLENVYKMISDLSKDRQLKTFIDQAEQCDRTIACATFSILMCNKLKFKGSTTGEILGLASFFQDVALYNSPFGDISETPLSELTDPAKAYYLNHPVISAELMSKTDDIPEVTLQVIRQQHERSDRTGFPNRIGGVQLQPVAEILSLINSYLDHAISGKKNTEFYQHYSDKVVAAFKEILAGLDAPILVPKKKEY